MMQFFGILHLKYTESAVGSSLYIKKKGKIYEKNKKSYCADFDRDVMHAAADGVQTEAADGEKHLDVLFTHDTHSHLNSYSTKIVNRNKKEVGALQGSKH